MRTPPPNVDESFIFGFDASDLVSFLFFEPVDPAFGAPSHLAAMPQFFVDVMRTIRAHKKAYPIARVDIYVETKYVLKSDGSTPPLGSKVEDLTQVTVVRLANGNARIVSEKLLDDLLRVFKTESGLPVNVVKYMRCGAEVIVDRQEWPLDHAGRPRTHLIVTDKSRLASDVYFVEKGGAHSEDQFCTISDAQRQLHLALKKPVIDEAAFANFLEMLRQNPTAKVRVCFDIDRTVLDYQASIESGMTCLNAEFLEFVRTRLEPALVGRAYLLQFVTARDPAAESELAAHISTQAVINKFNELSGLAVMRLLPRALHCPQDTTKFSFLNKNRIDSSRYVTVLFDDQPCHFEPRQSVFGLTENGEPSQVGFLFSGIQVSCQVHEMRCAEAWRATLQQLTIERNPSCRQKPAALATSPSVRSDLSIAHTTEQGEAESTSSGSGKSAVDLLSPVSTGLPAVPAPLSPLNLGDAVPCLGDSQCSSVVSPSQRYATFGVPPVARPKTNPFRDPRQKLVIAPTGYQVGVFGASAQQVVVAGVRVNESYVKK